LLTDVEVVVLGLVDNGIHYGYEIEKEIKNRNIRYWTDISFSSIYYILNKLEDRDYLTSNKEESTNRPSRKVYKLTETGRQELIDALKHNLSNRDKMGSSFNLGIGFLGALEKEDVITCLEKYIESIDDLITTYSSDLERVKPLWPEHIQGLYTRPITILNAEREWVKDFKEIIEHRIKN
jgi:DNA-binding PadR family transcriptional regulator